MNEPFLYRKTGECKTCRLSTPFVLYRQIFANGSFNYLWQCSRCNTKNPDRVGFYVAKELVEKHLSEEQIESLPTLTPQLYTRCARCGSRTAEMHHWAPKALFGAQEAENWPKDYLCKDCHDLWHRTVTPQIILHTHGK